MNQKILQELVQGNDVITNLNLKCCKIDFNSEFVQSILINKSLKILNLTGNPCSGFNEIKNIVFSSLKHVYLKDTGLKPSEISQIQHDLKIGNKKFVANKENDRFCGPQ